MIATGMLIYALRRTEVKGGPTRNRPSNSLNTGAFVIRPAITVALQGQYGLPLPGRHGSTSDHPGRSGTIPIDGILPQTSAGKSKGPTRERAPLR